MKTKKLAEKYTSKELAESFVFRTKISDKETKKSNAALKRVRENSTAHLSAGDALRLRLMQLKYQMEDWAKNPDYDSEKTFGRFLQLYAKIIQRKNVELANDISINTTRFSQIVNGHIIPSEKIVYRLECHANNIIPASTWLDILEKDIENKIRFDFSTRKAEYCTVKRRIDLSKTTIDFVKTSKREVLDLVDAYKSLVTTAGQVKEEFMQGLKKHPQLVEEKPAVYKKSRKK